MTPRSFVFVLALLVASPAVAQDSHGRQRDPGAATQSGGERQAGPREATPRSDPGRRESPPPPPLRTGAPATVAAPVPTTGAAQAPAPGGTSAQRGRDPGPDNRQAVPRGTRPLPAPDGRRDRIVVADGRRDRTTVIVQPRVYSGNYRPYYYYPRRSYPYGYGAFGLGYFYYDPYLWGPAYGSYYGYDPYYSQYGYGAGYGSGGYGYPTGELRVDVNPSYAEVYVDGYYAGRVDDFDGVFQSLRLEDGPHQIRIVAPGFQPMDLDVRIYAGRKITYRGNLFPLRP